MKNLYETKDSYVIKIRPDTAANKNSLFCVEIDFGVSVIMGKQGRAKHDDKWVKLFALVFDKELFGPDAALDYFSDYEIRYVTKKYSWDKKIPIVDDIINLDSGKYIAVCWRNIGEKEFFYKQLEQIEEGRVPLDIVLNTENPMISIFYEKLKSFEEGKKNPENIIKAFNYMEDCICDFNKDEIIDFGYMFTDAFYDSCILNRLYDERREIPQLLQYWYFDEREDFDFESYGEYVKMSPTAKKMINTFADYIVSIPKKKSLTASYGNGERDVLFLSPDIPDDISDSAMKSVVCLGTRLAKLGGGLIFRCASEEEGNDIVMAFRGHHKKIEALSASECKAHMELQPDGTIMQFPNETYKRPGVIL